MQDVPTPAAEIVLGEVVREPEPVVESSSEPRSTQETGIASKLDSFIVGDVSLVEGLKEIAIGEKEGVESVDASPGSPNIVISSSLPSLLPLEPFNITQPSSESSTLPPPTSSDPQPAPDAATNVLSTRPPPPVAVDPSPTPSKTKKRKNNKKKKPPKFYYNVTDILSHLNMGPFEGRPHSFVRYSFVSLFSTIFLPSLPTPCI